MPSDSSNDLLLGALLTGAAALSVAVLTGQTSAKGVKKNVSGLVKSARKQISGGGMEMSAGPGPDPSPREDPAPKPKEKRDQMSKDGSSNRATTGADPGGAGTGSTVETSFGPVPTSFAENRPGLGGGSTTDQTTFGVPKNPLETRGSLQGPAESGSESTSGTATTSSDPEPDPSKLKSLSEISDDPVTTTAAGDPLSDRDFARAARKAAREEGNLGLT